MNKLYHSEIDVSIVHKVIVKKEKELLKSQFLFLKEIYENKNVEIFLMPPLEMM